MRIGLFTDTYTPDINGVVSSIVTLQRELEKMCIRDRSKPVEPRD